MIISHIIRQEVMSENIDDQTQSPGDTEGQCVRCGDKSKEKWSSLDLSL